MRKGLMKYPLTTAAFALAGGLALSTAQAAPIPLGYISYDVNIPGSFAQFDIVNETGPNSTFPPDPTFPVTTTAQFTLSSLSLVVDFSDGSSKTFGPSYFTLGSDGESLDGSPIAIGGTTPNPISAVLTGMLSPTTLDVAGTSTSVDSSFDPATITDSPILVDGDLAIINAELASSGPAVPEPGMTFTFLVGSFMVLIISRRLRRRDGSNLITAVARFGGAFGAIFVSAAILLPGICSATVPASVKQNTATAPSSGVAGVSTVNITASGVPSGTPAANVTIKLAPTCTVGASGPVAGEVDATAISVRVILGTTDRINFSLPAALAQGTYFAQISDPTDGFAGGNCSIVMVTKTSATLNACVPTSSLGVVTGTTVTAYVPNGWWGGSTTGVQAIKIEGGGAPTAISTPNVVNSCAGNPATGQVVCTANNTDVYLISGTAPALTNTLTSGLTGLAGFSGGECQNCGVAVNALTNTAAIAGGAPSGSDGLQILNLNTNAFQPVFNSTQEVSEDISIDPGRNLILSPNEGSNYVLFSLDATTGAITGEFDNPINSMGGEPDSAAEDCTTGIALSSDEFTNYIYLANLAQAEFTAGSPPGTPGSWTAPFTLFFDADAGSGFGAGISGISIAPGSSHLGIYTGEFGGNQFGVLELPGTAGSGSPTVTDYVTGALPPTPDGFVFQTGCDPHTMTAYTSPNTGLAYGVVASWVPLCYVGGTPTWLAVIDLAKAIDPTVSPRTPGQHVIDPGVDLIANGVVRYVSVH